MNWLEEYGRKTIVGLVGLDNVDKEFLLESFCSLEDLEEYLRSEQKHHVFLCQPKRLRLKDVVEYLYSLEEEDL